MDDIKIFEKFSEFADSRANEIIRNLRNEERRFRLMISEKKIISSSFNEKLFGKWKKNKKTKKLERVTTGEIDVVYTYNLNKLRHELDRFSNTQFKILLADANPSIVKTGGLATASTVGSGAGIFAIGSTLTTTVISTTTVATQVTAPLFGIGFLGSIGLTTTSTVSVPIATATTVAAISTIELALASTGVGFLIGGGLFYWQNNKAKKKMLDNLEKISNLCCDNVHKMKNVALSEVEKREGKFKNAMTNNKIINIGL